jgi:predicted acylesterase/phospholipase RssA
MTTAEFKTKEMIEFFTKVCERTFTDSRMGMRALTRTFMIFRRFDSVYSRQPLEDAVKSIFGRNEKTGEYATLFSPAVVRSYPSTTRVAVTAARGSGETEVLITNYNRPSGDWKNFEREDDCHREFKIWEAAVATSAAPFYLPVFKMSRKDSEYIDGAVYANCPAKLALDEGRKLWPGDAAALDILLSLGTGLQGQRPDKIPTAVKFGGFTALQKMIERQLDSERSWTTLEDNTDPPTKHRMYRLNPSLEGKYVELYHYNEVPRLLREVTEWSETVAAVAIKNIADTMVASLFFFEPESTGGFQRNNNNHILLKGSIRCRLLHQSDAILKLLRERIKCFYYEELSREDVLKLRGPLPAAPTRLKPMKDAVSNSTNPVEMERLRDNGSVRKFRLVFEASPKDIWAYQMISIEFKDSQFRFPISGFPATMEQLESRAKQVWLQ